MKFDIPDLLKKKREEMNQDYNVPEAQDEGGSFLQKFMAASNDRSAIDAARKDADSNKRTTGVIQGLATMFGGGNKNQGFYDNLRAGADARVKSAELDHDKKLDNMLMQDKLGYQAVQRKREGEEFGWSRDDRITKNAMAKERHDWDKAGAGRDAQKHGWETRLNDPNAVVATIARKQVAQELQLPESELAGMTFNELKEFRQKAKAGGARFQQARLVGPNDEILASVFDTETGEYKTGDLKTGYAPKMYTDKATGETKLVTTDISSPRQTTLNAPTRLDPEKKQYTDTEIYNSLNPKQKEQVDQVQNNFIEQTKTLASKRSAAGVVRNLVAQGRQGEKISPEVFTTQMARLNGEVGALSEADKKGLAGEGGVEAMMKRLAELQFYTGEMRAEDLDFLENLTGAMDRAAGDSMERYRQTALKEIQMKTGLPAERASQLLHVTTAPVGATQAPKTTAGQYTPEQEAMIERMVKKYEKEGRSREQVIRALQKQKLLP